MKVLLITDQHFGVRNDNQTFQEIYKEYYGTVVIPFIKKNKIKNIICLGDTFDKRKSINFQSLDAAKEMWFDPLQEMGVHMWMLVGNHDIYYKNTVQVNAPNLLLNEYTNITVIDKVTDITIDDTDITMMPWICDDNMQEIMSAIKETDSKICMGHLELKGFMAHPGYVHEHGLDMSMFSKFDVVCSGHYHTKSSNGNINYLGNPYQLYWNDVYDDRGFHVLDTKTSKLKFYKNPYNTFEKIVYDDGVGDLPELKNRYVKLIVQKKSDFHKFDNFVKSLYDMGVADLKIIEDLTVELSDLDEDVETEDTLTLLENYIQDVETDIDKGMVTDIVKSLYQEAVAL